MLIWGYLLLAFSWAGGLVGWRVIDGSMGAHMRILSQAGEGGGGGWEEGPQGGCWAVNLADGARTASFELARSPPYH